MRGWGEEGEDNSKNASKLETKGRTDWQQCTATDEMGGKDGVSPPRPPSSAGLIGLKVDLRARARGWLPPAVGSGRWCAR